MTGRLLFLSRAPSRPKPGACADCGEVAWVELKLKPGWLVCGACQRAGRVVLKLKPGEAARAAG